MASRIGMVCVAASFVVLSTAPLHSHPNDLTEEELKRHCTWDQYIKAWDHKGPPEELYLPDGSWSVTHILYHCAGELHKSEDLLQESDCHNLVGNYKNTRGSIWKIRLNEEGDYIACEKGLGSARANSVEFEFPTLTIKWCTGRYWGTYEWDMNEKCSKGQGAVDHEKGPRKGFNADSDITRTASPFHNLEPCPQKMFDQDYCKGPDTD